MAGVEKAMHGETMMDYEAKESTVKDALEYIIESLETIAVLKPITWDDLVVKNIRRLQEIADKL